MMPPNNKFVAGMIILIFGVMAMQQLGFDFKNLTLPAIIAALVSILGIYLLFKGME